MGTHPIFESDFDCLTDMTSRHEAVSCDNCLQTNFEGIRFKCLICFDYDLCERCHTNGATTQRHLSSHPMQCILTRSDTDMLYRGEHSLIQDAFTCPHCGVYGFKAAELSQHVIDQHSNENQPVICPICTVMPSGDPNQMIRDLARHMTNEHTNQSARRTIDGIRRMIYPSRRVTNRNRGRGQNNSDRSGVPFMQFMHSDPHGEHLVEDSLNELLSQISNQPSRNRINQNRRNQTQESSEERSPERIPHRLLLDNLSDEEEQIPDDVMRQKTHFFQDLLLSTLTDRKLTVKVTGLACPSSSSCSSSGSPSDKHSKSPSDSKNQKKKNKENNNNNSRSSDNED